jgi:2-oxoisovalerate dehydrogenase E2 component (dihydrolipoyl transacylase)
VTSPQQFRLPDVGEGLTDAEILHWLVGPGDTVEINQIIVEVETAKAAVELPSPYAGVVTALHAREGESVDVGVPLITISTAAAESRPSPERPVEPREPGAVEVPEEEQPEEEQAALLVGYGPQAGARRGRRRPPPVPPRASRVPDSAPASARTASVPVAVAVPVPVPVAAKPPVRKFAKDLGVDIAAVLATGPDGTVTREDIQQAAAALATGTRPAVPQDVPPAAEPGTVRGAEGVRGAEAVRGAETRVPVRGVRKHTAAAMVASAFTAPHVTEFITLDVTATMVLRDTVAARREFQGLRVTPLLFVARALLLALRRTPEANSTWDEGAQEIVLKHYVNLGIAAATDRGLVVPNIKHADRMSLRELADAIGALTATARAGRTTPQDMSAGSVTITNVGVFGIDTGTPILNPGEAAILAMGAIRRTPWVVTDSAGVERVEPRWVTQLALSFDHRLLDGQQGSRLLADTAAVLRDPGLAVL